MKVFSSEALREVSLVAAELFGEQGLDAGTSTSAHDTDIPWLERYFRTFGGTISAGSSEIQRNIVAEKVLGLPRG
jgi:alkylation response protein AidB-like acyl-CoA dehydrogenase